MLVVLDLSEAEGPPNTGAHKINNALGQVLLAKRMRQKKIAETGAGSAQGQPPPQLQPFSIWTVLSIW